jgi:outer membrane protein assembly factor BamB
METASSATSLVYLGTRGAVLALHGGTGARAWQVDLPEGSDDVTLLLDGARLFAACHRAVACVDAVDGHLLWSREARVSSHPTLALDPVHPGGRLFVGTLGAVLAFRADDGLPLWRNDLPGLGYGHVTLRVAEGIATDLVRADDGGDPPCEVVLSEGQTTTRGHRRV